MDRIKNAELFLASSSPRRKELLAKLGIPFKVAAFDADEKVPDGMTAESAVEYLACLKARCAAERVNGIVIGADTVVEKDGHIMGPGVVDVLLAGETVQGGVFAVVDVHGKAVVGLHDIRLIHFSEFFKGHGHTSFSGEKL